MVAGSRKPARGFTLIEVLLVLALSFVGLFGMMSLLIAAQRAAMSARTISEATALAQDRLEQTEHAPLATLANLAEAGLGPQGMAVEGGLYARNTFVAINGVNTTVRVQVTWTDTAERTHQVNVVTVRAP